MGHLSTLSLSLLLATCSLSADAAVGKASRHATACLNHHVSFSAVVGQLIDPGLKAGVWLVSGGWSRPTRLGCPPSRFTAYYLAFGDRTSHLLKFLLLRHV